MNVVDKKNPVCIRGHKYILENTGRDKRGHRYCKTCKREKSRKRIGFRGHEYKSNTCKRGHLMNDSNTYVRSDDYKRCKLCTAHYVRERNDAKYELDGNYSLLDECITRTIFKDQCFKCKSKDKLSIDHHRSLYSGHGLEVNNAVILCKPCNSRKSNKDPEAFYSVLELDELYLLFTEAMLLQQKALD